MRRFLVALGAIVALSSFGAVAASAQTTAGPQTALTKALRNGLRQAHGASGAYVIDLTTGQQLFAWKADLGREPASVEKLYTTSTALLRFGPTATLTTSIFGMGTQDSLGTWHGTLYLRGGGDPTFGSADFDSSFYGTGATVQALVAALVQQTGITGVKGRILGDTSYFDSLPGTSESGFQFDPYMEGSLSALAYDRGLTPDGSSDIAHPASYAAGQLAAALRSDNVKLGKHIRIGAGRAPAGARLLATVQSPPIATLIALTNTPSDNFFAEMLLKGLGASFGGGGTTAAGAAVVRTELASKFGITPTLVDGSGLSREDRATPRQVVTLLQAMAGNSDFVDSLAIAGETGTLQDEMRGTAAQGRCRGKTGTLSDVASLAGYCEARDGHMIVFAFLMNSLADSGHGHLLEAHMAVALAKYNG